MFHLRCRSRLDLDWRFFATSSHAFCGSCERELHERLTARWTADGNDVDALACLSVRAAWDLLLRSVDWPAGSKILMSAVSVPEMFRIVERRGFVAVPLDVDATTGAPRVEQIDAKLDDATRAVLLAPLFGRPVRWADAARRCETRGVLTIEDRAQYFPENVQQQTRSDSQVLLYSFGPLKRLTALGGAIVRTQRTPLLQSMRQNQHLLPQQSDLQYFRRVAKYVGLFALMNPCAAAWFATALKCTRRNLDDVVDRLVRNLPPDQPTAIGTRPSSALLRQMCQRQDHLSCWNRVNSQRVRQWLSGLPACFQADTHAEHLYWMVTLQADDTEAVRKKLLAQGFDSGRLSRLTAWSYRNAKDAQHGMEGAKQLLSRTLIVPCYAGVSDTELTRLATVLQSVHMPISGQIQPSRNGR